MFIWNHSLDHERTLPEELLNSSSVRQVRIATAFFSTKGLALLRRMKEQYQLEKEDIVLYMSSEFSMDNPGQLLTALAEVCQTRVVFQRMFHPKVYFLQGAEDKLIFGSANFTGGGMGDNVEFVSVICPDDQQTEVVNRFFAYCNTVSLPVDGDMIAFYEENASAFTEFQSAQKSMKRRLSGYIKKEVAMMHTADHQCRRKGGQDRGLAACSAIFLIAAKLPSLRMCSKQQASSAAVCPSTCKTSRK